MNPMVYPLRFQTVTHLTALACVLFPTILSQPLLGQELEQRQAWQNPSDDETQAWLRSARQNLGQNPDDGPAAVHSASGDRLLDFCRQLAELDPRFREVFETCQHPLVLPVPAFPVLQDRTISEHARANLQLLYGRWLATSMLTDEALEVLQEVSPDRVVDPAALLFYRAVAFHHLGRDDEALANLALLRSNSEMVPQRFTIVSDLLEADLKATSRHKLDPIARLMDRIQTRLSHARAGTRVRKEESEVIRQLDAMIEELEKQLQAARAAAQQKQQQAGRGGAPATPAPDSMQAAPQGVGDVTPRTFADKSDWGNLPPKERERALQQLSKDFPSHYREIVERYFRKLAQESSGSP